MKIKLQTKLIGNFLRKNKFLIILLAIIFLGAFLRAYHFSDWLHFELDQSRDAKIIDLAMKEGPAALPLLGPKAAGSFLRLGPAFYYFKYLSALIFGNTPSGMATIIMIFGILAMPAFYFLSRRYFGRWLSLSLLVLFSTSLFLIMYSRFSWNPNTMPLFIILMMYFLLRAVDENEEQKKRGWSLMIAAFCLAVSTQLHFLAFVSVPVIVVLFLLVKRPRIRWMYWLGAIAIILFMNLPVFLNEAKTGGANFKEFKEVAMGKSNKNSDRTLIEKIFKNYTENSLNHFLILSSQNTELPGLVQKNNFDIKCDQSCRDNWFLGMISLVLFSIGIILLFKNLILEKEKRKKDFLIMIFIWFLVSFVLFIPLAFDISPRFWLLVSALPFVFLGLTFDFIIKILPKKIAIGSILILVLVFCASNLYKTYLRFSELRNASSEAVKVSADRILKEKNRVTLEQQYMIIDYINSFYKQNGYPVYLNSEPFYRRSFLFHLDRKNVPRDDLRNAVNDNKIYRNGNYFLIYPTSANLDKEMNEYAGTYNVIGKKEFGTLTVFQLYPKTETINAEQQIIEPESGKSKSAPGVPKRYTWEEIFNEDNTNNEDNDF